MLGEDSRVLGDLQKHEVLGERIDSVVSYVDGPAVGAVKRGL